MPYWGKGLHFTDRREAGRLLARELTSYAGRDDVIVLALPRGGVPVGYEIAKALGVPLDVFIVRKLGVPGREELAMGAIATGGVRVLNSDVIEALAIADREIEQVTRREEAELMRRESLYRGDRVPMMLAGRTSILVDDGIATGASMWSALVALKDLKVAHSIVAVPVAPEDTKSTFEKRAEDFVCLSTPSPFGGVGAWYSDFTQTDDEEVRRLLAEF
ncbi:phosphoribosyltransferase [bacterium]|nr:phosphoribosyltransferase [bacterium]